MYRAEPAEHSGAYGAGTRDPKLFVPREGCVLALIIPRLSWVLAHIE
ncbi:MAG: hypothetical protein ACLS5Z_06655 [Clostridium fessum]